MTNRMFAVAAALSVCAGSASAVQITFLHQGSGSGTINGVPFGGASPAAFTITAVGDTDNRQTFSGNDGYWIDHASASITIDGVGTFNFVTATRTFINSSSGVPGFARAGEDGFDLLDGPFGVPELLNWDMTTSVGPFTGLGFLGQWSLQPVVTSGGVLNIFDQSNPTVTFQAIVVPAPGAAALAGLALLGASRRRRGVRTR